MPKTPPLTLDDLKVQSFVTTLEKEALQETAHGGTAPLTCMPTQWQPTCVEDCTAGMICSLISFCSDIFACEE